MIPTGEIILTFNCMCIPPTVLTNDPDVTGQTRCEKCGMEIVVAQELATGPRLRLVEGGS